MFEHCLFVTCVAWALIATVAAFTRRMPAVLVACAVTAVGGFVCTLGAVVLPFQALLIAALAAPFRRPGVRGTAAFAALSAALSAVPFAAIYYSTVRSATFARLRNQYPYESVSERVAPPAPTAPLTAEANADLAAVATTILDDEHWTIGLGYRPELLEKLHERAVELFVTSPGFGLSRGLPYDRPNDHNLKPGDCYDGQPPRQPGPRIDFAWSSDLLPPGDFQRFGTTHRDGVAGFVRPRAWGYVKDREHVAGFEPHRFRDVPKNPAPWALSRVELIGLVVHPQPVVYVGDTLPAMAAGRATPTRPLDGFEAVGLEALQRGESLFARERPPHAKAVGAIRATPQCVACHGGREGDLLGAFAYSLTR